MDKIDINEIIKTAAGALDLSNFKGDVVMFKHVDKEMNVAEGGIGEQHIHHHYAEDKSDDDNGCHNIHPSDSEKPISVALNGSQQQMLESEKQKGEKETDVPLIRFILNDKDREKVLNGLRVCEDTGQVAAFAKRIYTEEIMPREDLRSIDFFRAIIPLLKFETTVVAIKQAVYKQVE